MLNGSLSFIAKGGINKLKKSVVFKLLRSLLLLLIFSFHFSLFEKVRSQQRFCL
jgi:hypothetical protein